MNKIDARSLSGIRLWRREARYRSRHRLSPADQHQPAAKGLGRPETSRNCRNEGNRIGHGQAAVEIDRMEANRPAAAPRDLGRHVTLGENLTGIEDKACLLSLRAQPSATGLADGIEAAAARSPFGKRLIALMTTSSLRTRWPLPPRRASAVLRRTTGFACSENRSREPADSLGENDFGGSMSNSWCASTGMRAESR